MAFYKNDEERMFQGWASVEIKDKDGETIPMDVLRPQMDKFMNRGAPINLNHSNWAVGKVTSYDFRKNDEAGADGLWVVGQIHKDFPIDDDAWKGIQDESLNEMSIAGQFEIGEDGVATWAAPMEISLTGPAVNSKAVNPAATIEEKTEAKSEADGGIVEKSELDEQINKKKSEIDEQLNKKKADADAEAARKKADAEAEAEAAKKKADADAEAEALKMKDGAVPPENPGGAVAAPAGAEHADAAQDEAQYKEMYESLNSRVMKLESVMDTILQEEEDKTSTDANLQRAEQKPGAGASSPMTGEGNDNAGVPDKETLAKMSKEIARLGKANEEITAKLSKFEATGVRRLVASSSAGTAGSFTSTAPEVATVTGILGEIDR
jgi:hypothetical protein